MTSVKERSSVYGEKKLVIPSNNVHLKSKSFLELVNQRSKWVFQDHYCNPGPIQFTHYGRDTINKTLTLEHANYSLLLNEIEEYCEKIKASCKFGSHEDILKIACSGLKSLKDILEITKKK
jgi:6-phosphofructokinase 1